MIGESGDAEIYPREIETLTGAQFAANGHRAIHFVAFNLINQKLYESIIQKQAIAGFYDTRKRLETHGSPAGVADDVVAGQGKLVTSVQVDRLRVDRSQPHLGTWQVRHDRNPLTRSPGSATDPSNDLPMLIEGAVRKVKPGNVHTGSDEALQHFRGVGRRADRRNDLGFMIGQYHRTPFPACVVAQGSTKALRFVEPSFHIRCIVSFQAARMKGVPTPGDNFIGWGRVCRAS